MRPQQQRSQPLTSPRRYQLTKQAVRIARAGHPWIFRGRLSSAANVFANGQWLELVDGENQVVGYGLFQARGAIAVRILRLGPEPPNGDWVATTVRAALDRRAPLRGETDAFRAIHGESDGLAAVTADIYGSVAVVSSYARGADAIARLAARILRRDLGLAGVLWKPGARRLDEASPLRVLAGSVAELLTVYEDRSTMTVAPRWGQKSGSFLDLRGLRRYLRNSQLDGSRVLDLFSYTGTLGAAAESAGAREIWHVDRSRPALELGEKHHVLDRAKHRFVEADVFEWLPELSADERFDLVVADPPQMTSRTSQVPSVLRAYDRLYHRIAGHVPPGGIVVACCCTSRVDVETFRVTVRKALGREFRFVRRLPSEADHPVGFPEADYLKILIFRRRTRAHEGPSVPVNPT